MFREVKNYFKVAQVVREEMGLEPVFRLRVIFLIHYIIVPITPRKSRSSCESFILKVIHRTAYI